MLQRDLITSVKSRIIALETTSLHLYVLRDLKRIHSHICSVAYQVLDVAGEAFAAEVAESDPITLASSGVAPSRSFA